MSVLESLESQKLSKHDLKNVLGGAKEGKHSLFFGLVTWETFIHETTPTNGGEAMTIVERCSDPK